MFCGVKKGKRYNLIWKINAFDKSIILWKNLGFAFFADKHLRRICFVCLCQYAKLLIYPVSSVHRIQLPLLCLF